MTEVYSSFINGNYLEKLTGFIRKKSTSDSQNTYLIICKVIPFTLVILLTALLSFMIAPRINVNAAGNQAEQSSTHYSISSVQIQPGDTFWSIATEYYSTEFGSFTDYISEIKRMNQISDDTIYAGCFIVVPTYIEDTK